MKCLIGSIGTWLGIQGHDLRSDVYGEVRYIGPLAILDRISWALLSINLLRYMPPLYADTFFFFRIPPSLNMPRIQAGEHETSENIVLLLGCNMPEQQIVHVNSNACKRTTYV